MGHARKQAIATYRCIFFWRVQPAPEAPRRRRNVGSQPEEAHRRHSIAPAKRNMTPYSEAKKMLVIRRNVGSSVIISASSCEKRAHLGEK